MLNDMKILLPYIFFILFSTFSYAQDAQESEEEDPTFTIRHGGESYEVKGSENAALKKLYDQIKEKTGAGKAKQGNGDASSLEQTDAANPTQTQAVSEPKFEGSKSTAEEAYESGDYETAYEHYKALSDEGDAEASKVLAVMHSEGKGVEKDANTTIAYFARAAEQGDEDAQQLMDKTYFTEKQRMGIDESFKSITEGTGEAKESNIHDATAQDARQHSSQYGGISPSNIVGFYESANKQPAFGNNSYTPEKTQYYGRAPAKTFSFTLARSYDSQHLQLKKQFKEESVNEEEN